MSPRRLRGPSANWASEPPFESAAEYQPRRAGCIIYRLLLHCRPMPENDNYKVAAT